MERKINKIKKKFRFPLDRGGKCVLSYRPFCAYVAQ